MKQEMLILMMLFAILLTACETKTPTLNCPVCENRTQECSTSHIDVINVSETKYVNVTIIKYQCIDGSIKDILDDCPATIAASTPIMTSYDTAKHLINKAQQQGTFTFTLKYAGYSDTQYRIDFEITNNDAESQYFQPSAIAILDDQNNQYDVVNSYDYPVDTLSTTILPGVTKKGYWLFDKVPKKGTDGTFRFDIGFMNKDTFSFKVPLY
jgi:hypothetical protein